MIQFAYRASRAGVREKSDGLEVVLPNRLLGRHGESLGSFEAEFRQTIGFRWEEGFALQWSAVTADCRKEGTRAASERLYRQLLGSLGNRSIYRIWNFVPRINEEEDGLEVYQQFSFGRSVAFEAVYAGDVEARIPAASAVGTPGDQLAVVALTGGPKPRFLENPAQVPAYNYPPAYGPRSPSFARATAVEIDGVAWLFLSGTAAIRGSSSCCVGDVAAQTALTVENLGTVAAEADFDVHRPRPEEKRFFRVYLRHERDHPVVSSILDDTLLRSGDRIEYLQAEICRADLAVEIEATLSCPK